MSAADFRYEYLSSELVEYQKKLESAAIQVKQAKEELNSVEWQWQKYKAIVDMLEIAYKANLGDT
jgi:chromosome segregation ATPase